MNFLRRFFAFFRKEKLDRDLSEEIGFHLSQRTAENIQDGLPPEEARFAALREFGGVEQIKEQARDERDWVWLEQLGQDLRFAVRTLRRNPGFSLVAVLTLALGIGANTAMFSVVDAVVLRPLPFREPDRLMLLDEKWLPRFSRFEATAQDFQAWQQQSGAFEAMAAYASTAYNLTGDDRPERLAGARINANLPALLGVEPLLGRSFTPGEDQPGNESVVLLSHRLWQRRFNGDASVVGTAIRLNDASCTVVGVMPASFDFPLGTDAWKPMAFTDQDLTKGHFVRAVARLKPGATPAQAQADLNVIMPRIKTPQVWSANVIPIMEQYVGEVRTTLALLLGAAGFVLLIACVNVINLLLLRGAARHNEIFLRASLGASRGRIVRQLLTETLLLALVGGAGGVALALGAMGLIKKLQLSGIPRLDQATLDYRVLGFALALTTLTGLLFGLVPALRLSRGNFAAALKTKDAIGATAGRPWLRHALVVSELAFALVLLTGAGLLLKSFARLQAVPRGFNPESVLAAKLNLPGAGYTEPLRQTQFVERLLETLRRAPEVREAAVSAGLPFSGVDDAGIRFDGRDGASPLVGTTANYYRVSPLYVTAMQIPLRRGRLLTEADAAGKPPVVLINETMARRFFPDQDPIGQRLDIAGPTYLREIVGVVGDVKQVGLKTPPSPQVYEPFAQKPTRSFHVVVRGTGDPTRLAEIVRQAVRALDGNLPVADVRMMNERVELALTRDWFSAFLLGLFAALALVLAAVGTYGVMAYSVAQRTREIGIRLALGASPRGILRLVLGQSFRVVFLGLGIGVAAALALSRVVGSLLYDTGSRDPGVFAAVLLLLLAVALLATLLPARRAARVDPMVTLRGE